MFVTRFSAGNFCSASRLQQTAQKMGLPTASGYGTLIQDLDDYYQGELGRSADYAEGVAAFSAKRPARFTGH